ncbi:MAG: DUF3237 domain-containing protein [Actinomycetota bacterium]|nr:DUF3237 domain-containing protein [Actinomycetota bacterium]
MPSLEKFCTITADMGMKVIGNTPAGMRIDFPFDGMATGPHWEGERPVKGTDYATVRGDGNMDLDIHATIGEKRDAVAYEGSGVSIANPDKSAEPRELLTFQTGNEDLAWLNNEIGVALGKGEAGKLTVEIFLVKPS